MRGQTVVILANQKTGPGDSDTRRYQACNVPRQLLTYEQLITKQNGLASGTSWQFCRKIFCDLMLNLFDSLHQKV